MAVKNHSMNSRPELAAAALWQRDFWQIYRNASPEASSTLDAAALEGQFAFDLLTLLFANQPFQLAVQPSFDDHQRLQDIYFESRVRERVSGATSFALGFPLFVGQDQAGELIAAPLLIWRLSIEPGAKVSDGWTISRRPFQHVVYNRFLAQHWAAVPGLEELAAELAAAVSGGLPAAAALAAVCDRVNEALGVPPSGGQVAIAKLPSSKALEQLAAPGRIVWAGSLGIFPPHAHLFAAPEWALEEKAPRGHPFGLLPLSPEQASAAEHVRHHARALITGPAGSGKTHLAAHLLSNALSNHWKCLYVSPRAGALSQMQRHLERMGLGRLSFLLRDINLDLGLFLEILRAEATGKDGAAPEKPEDFAILVARLERVKEKLDSTYRASRKTVLSTASWTEAVGRYLKSSRQEGKESLATQLHAQDYQFDEDSYRQLSEAIAACQRLHGRSSGLLSPLNKLHPGVFLHFEKAEARAFVEEQLELLNSRAAQLQQWYANRIDVYASRLSAHYEQYFQDHARQLSGLQDQLAEYRGQYGDDFLGQGAAALRFKKMFSARARKIVAARQEFAAAYERLARGFSVNPYFDFQFDEAAGGAAISAAKESLERFAQALQQWHAQQQTVVQEELARLSPKTTLPVLNFEEQAIELENGLEALLEQVNESGLYHLPTHNKMLTLPKQQRLLEGLVEQLETTRLALPEFDEFYDWQRNWLQLSEQGRRLVKALIKLRPKNWQAAFDSWFLDNAISRSYESALPLEEDSLSQLALGLEQLQELLPGQILADWQSRKEQAVSQLRRSSSAAAQWLAGKSLDEARQHWLPLFEKATESIATLKPAMLVTPHLAGELFAQAGLVFDFILVDEAQDLLPEEADLLMRLSPRTVFLAAVPAIEGAAEPPGCAAIAAMGAERFDLHQTLQRYPVDLFRPESLQALPAAAAGQLSPANAGVVAAGSLSALGEKGAREGGQQNLSGFSIAFEQVEGLYDEERQANEDEALYVISLLNRIERTPQRTYPSVGIACMTKGQRRLIASYLLNIKQRRSTGVETIQQLERNGLAVLALDELAGQHFDMLIISGTYGLADVKGRLSNDLEQLDGQLEQLLLLMSRTGQRVIMLNSMPIEVLQGFLAQPSRKPLWLLAAYFLAARAAGRSDWGALRHLVEGLPGWTARSWPYPQPLGYLEEVGAQLRPYLAPGRIRFAVEDPHELAPLRVLPPADGLGQACYVAVEGFLSQTPATDYHWEYTQRLALAAQGFLPLIARPADWWRDPERQAKRLASAIIMQEQKMVPEEEE
jgi:ribosomal protein S15P/S13E